MLSALIMAGGQGTRMARSGASRPKPLVEVAGVPVIERNFQQLVRAGIERVVVSVAADAEEIRAFVVNRMRPLGAALGVDVRELVETTPLGNIGAAGLLRDEVDDLLVVYADNVTAIDLAALVREHHAGPGSRRDLTLAAHHEPFAIPYGELTVDDGGRLTAYTEKPTHRILVGSAVMVIGSGGLAALATDEPTGISQLAQRLVDAGGDVRVVVHDAPWVDVNDVAAIDTAEAMVTLHRDEFELWLTGEVEPWTLDLCLGDGASVTVDDVQGAAHGWRRGAPDDDPVVRANSLGGFDAVDVASGRRLRIHPVMADHSPSVPPTSESAPPIGIVAERVAAHLRARRGAERPLVVRE